MFDVLVVGGGQEEVEPANDCKELG